MPGHRISASWSRWEAIICFGKSPAIIQLNMGKQTITGAGGAWRRRRVSPEVTPDPDVPPSAQPAAATCVSIATAFQPARNLVSSPGCRLRPVPT